MLKKLIFKLFKESSPHYESKQLLFSAINEFKINLKSNQTVYDALDILVYRVRPINFDGKITCSIFFYIIKTQFIKFLDNFDLTILFLHEINHISGYKTLDEYFSWLYSRPSLFVPNPFSWPFPWRESAHNINYWMGLNNIWCTYLKAKLLEEFN